MIRELNAKEILIRQGLILSARDKYKLEFGEIGNIFGVSKQRIQQIYEVNSKSRNEEQKEK